MTKVPEYNLPKFGYVPATKQEQTNSLYWRYKKTTPPKDVYKQNKKKTKLIDKSLIAETIDHQAHIRSIKHEL